jgi:hypothetical protein
VSNILSSTSFAILPEILLEAGKKLQEQEMNKEKNQI